MLRPPPIRTADHWANEERILPAGSPEPGPFKSERTPYMIPIMRAFADPKYSQVVAVTGTQQGKSDTVLNIMGWRLADDPVPMLYIGPKEKQVTSFSQERFTALLDGAAGLKSKLDTKRNKATEKFVNGVRVGFGWASSPTELASHPAGLVLVDERDRMDNTSGDEGDPGGLAEARTSNFADGKIGYFSTPVMGAVETYFHSETDVEHWAVPEYGEDDENPVQSPIWLLWQEGTRHEWNWPCPDCGEYFAPRKKYLVGFDATKHSPYQSRKLARLACPHCGVMIDERHKEKMNDRGVYLSPGQKVVDGAVVGEPLESSCASYWVSALCSPWVTFGQRGEALVRAIRSRDLDKLKVTTNTGFGELFSLGGEAPPWETFAALRARYYRIGDTPAWVQRVTCGVDVQADRLYYAIRGWGADKESWLLDYGELHGPTERPEVWVELDELLMKTYNGQGIAMALIDSGYVPGEKRARPANIIYTFCRERRARKIYPAKGRNEPSDQPAQKRKLDINERGKLIKAGVSLWVLDSGYFKSFVHGKAKEHAEGGAATWHIPDNADDEYCKQLASEAQVATARNAMIWKKVRRDNHYLDCEALNAAAAHILQLHKLQPMPGQPRVNRVVAVPTAEAPKVAAPSLAEIAAAAPPKLNGAPTPAAVTPRTFSLAGWARK